MAAVLARHRSMYVRQAQTHFVPVTFVAVPHHRTRASYLPFVKAHNCLQQWFKKVCKASEKPYECAKHMV